MFYFSKKTILLVCLFFQHMLIAHCAFQQHAITIKTDDQSIVNNVFAYSFGKWLAYKYGLPFYTQTFVGSENFSFETEDVLLPPDSTNTFVNTVNISSEDELIKCLNLNEKPTLFTVGRSITLHFAPSLVETIHWPDAMTNFLLHIATHPPLGKSLEKALHIMDKKATPEIPCDKITVAVFIRKGTKENLPLVSTQYEDEWSEIITKKICKPFFAKGSDFLQPLQFPPEQFYADQIRKLSAIFYDAPLYVCIFTDDKKPEEIVNRLQKRVHNTNISFAYNQHNDCQDSLLTILNDISLMSQFDCLIRPQSDIACIAQLIGNHRVVMFPQTTSGKMEQLLNQVMVVVDNVSILFHNNRTHFIKCCACNDVSDLHKKYAMLAIKS